MKKHPQDSTESKDKKQDNIGYENTEKSNDQDEKDNTRIQTTNTGHGEGPKESEDDTEGLRSESGSKSLGKETGNTASPNLNHPKS